LGAVSGLWISTVQRPFRPPSAGELGHHLATMAQPQWLDLDQS
jgi:hypothetical protein